MNNYRSLTGTALFFLIALRIAIGWHFLYEGLVKLFNPTWTSSGYLMDSHGFMTSIFKSVASSPWLLRLADVLNEWGLILIGTALILGYFTRPAVIAGMILLALYYFSHPPFIMYSYALPSEGSYFLVDKIMIEFIALGVLLAFRTELIIGIDRLRNKKFISENGK